MTWDELKLAVAVRTDREDFDLELLEPHLSPEAAASDGWGFANRNYITRRPTPAS